MKISRIDGPLPAPTEVRAVRGLAVDEPAGATLAARLGAALSSPDPAGALRVLIEEIRSELQGRLGPAAPPLPQAHPEPLDADAAATVLLRYLRLAARGGGGDALPAESLREAVEAGVSRTRAVLASAARVPPSVQAAVDEVVARVRAATATLAPRPAAPPAIEELPRAMLREVAASLAERIGMLPRGPQATPAPAGPREALEGLARVFADIDADSVLAVRASPRVVEAAVREGLQRALASLPSPVRSDPAPARLASDLATLALRVAANPAAALPAPRDPATALGLVVAEFRQVLAEWSAEPRSPTAPTPAPVESVSRALGALAEASAEALLRAPPAEAVTLRAVLESAIERALARSVLQLPAAGGPPRAAAEQAQAAFRALLAAVDSAAVGRGLDVRGFIGLLAQAGEALQADGHPPFRFDLPVTRPAGGRRRPAPGARRESIEAIESSEPDEGEAGGDGQSEGPPLWPRPPAA